MAANVYRIVIESAHDTISLQMRQKYLSKYKNKKQYRNASAVPLLEICSFLCLVWPLAKEYVEEKV